MLVDANLLLYASDQESPHHDAAATWPTERLNGPERFGLPWPSLIAYMRITTSPRLLEQPLSRAQAWDDVERWLAAPAAWTPVPTPRHAEVLGCVLAVADARGPLVPDAHLAALALEHGVAVASADSDFARFPEVRWVNPLLDG